MCTKSQPAFNKDLNRWLFIRIALLGILVWGLLRFSNSALIKTLPLSDFIEYWTAGRVFLQGGDPYSRTELSAIQHSLGMQNAEPLMMWNPPWTLPLVAPASLLPYQVARTLWFLFSALLLLLTADWFWRFYGGPLSYRFLSWFGALIFIPNGAAVYLGQISPLMLLGLAGFLGSLQKKRCFLAGIFLAFVTIKPHVVFIFWILLLFWICKERLWKIAAGLLTALIVCLMAVSLRNMSIFLSYLSALAGNSGPLIWQTPTWGVALQMLFPTEGHWIRFLPTFLGAALSVWIWARWRNSFNWHRHLAPILILSILTSSFTWMFDWVVLLPVISLFLVWFVSRTERTWWLPAGYIAIDLILLHEPSLAFSNFYCIWVPPALGVLFVAGKRYASPF